MATVVYAGHREHPVMLIDQGMLPFVCEECGKKGTGPRYSCDVCGDYYLHVGCASLPQTLYSSAHPEHALTVEYVERPSRNCDICGHKMGGGWNYFCRACDFGADGRCCFPPATGGMATVVYKGHRGHTLRLVDRGTASFVCEDCGKEGTGPRYSCNVCGDYYLHVGCASLNPTAYSSSHPQHTLRLDYHDKWRRHCRICGHRMGGGWHYCCCDCDFNCHARCCCPLPPCPPEQCPPPPPPPPPRRRCHPPPPPPRPRRGCPPPPPPPPPPRPRRGCPPPPPPPPPPRPRRRCPSPPPPPCPPRVCPPPPPPPRQCPPVWCPQPAYPPPPPPCPPVWCPPPPCGPRRIYFVRRPCMRRC